MTKEEVARSCVSNIEEKIKCPNNLLVQGLQMLGIHPLEIYCLLDTLPAFTIAHSILIKLLNTENKDIQKEVGLIICGEEFVTLTNVLQEEL
ncbi:hypothetical protein [Bacillus atrophaeus]|uniref:hypothetical protein n=1 Tax=Bacillus atrophaeus TaxID=1452 RepID=UPI002280B0EF|nr:hypothetical protein [Bacillus atrophaeus]MCY7947987.1 hypothetical protein [Bacillus atrophaeus]MCY8098067.1 hypothetical protein [Bacillus atrophaeus]MCY9169991.1 hypothetical protein [Bacillus atrophaeus]MEC0740717.1 hypothetical protein [Bacillus atrophaeus]MEC0747020.1 hypothetical protein [Bacillus atrophaeus]